MDLEDALGSAEGNSQSAGVWGGSGGNSQSAGVWGGSGDNSQSAGVWGGPGGNSQPTGPWGGSGGNSQPTGPWGGSGGNSQPTGPWGGSGGNNPSTGPWPVPGGQPPAPNPTWQGGQGNGGGMWPGSPGPLPGPSFGPGPGPAVVPQPHLTVPYSQTLPSGVYDKLLITITGCVKPNPNKIMVDLYADKDLAFHFNPRFNENGKKVIVRNSRIRNQWGREERECSSFPFAAGQPFEMKILCTNQEFKVAVNNSHLLAYKHRVKDLRSINKLCIYSDLTLSKVAMETLP